MGKIAVGFQLEEHELEELKAIAHRSWMSPSAMARTIVRDYLEGKLIPKVSADRQEGK